MTGDKVECSFCGHDQYNTLHLIKNNGVHICRDCVVKGIDLLTKSRQKHAGVKKVYLASELGRTCYFCTRKLIEVRAATSITGGKNYICDECLMNCFDIILRQIFGKRRPSNESIYFLVYK